VTAGESGKVQPGGGTGKVPGGEVGKRGKSKKEKALQQTILPVQVQALKKWLLLEWYIKLFLGVHFAANWVPVH
jgi:hypothetical protein